MQELYEHTTVWGSGEIHPELVDPGLVTVSDSFSAQTFLGARAAQKQTLLGLSGNQVGNPNFI